MLLHKNFSARIEVQILQMESLDDEKSYFWLITDIVSEQVKVMKELLKARNGWKKARTCWGKKEKWKQIQMIVFFTSSWI